MMTNETRRINTVRVNTMATIDLVSAVMADIDAAESGQVGVARPIGKPLGVVDHETAEMLYRCAVNKKHQKDQR